MSAANYDVWSSWNSSPLLPIFLFLLTFSITIFSLTTKKNRHGQQLPPGPLGLPLLGYLPFLGPDLHREFTKLSETYGPIYKLWLGKKLCVVITSPTIAREVVREQDVVFANRDTTIASLAVTYGGIDIAYSDYGEYWRKIRKIFVRHMMSNANLEACYGLRKMEVWRSIRSLYSGNRVGKAVDIGEVASATMVNATAALVWGHTVEDDGQGESFKAELREVVAQLTLVLGLPNVSDFIPFMARFDLQGVGKQARKVHQWLDSFLDSVIQQAIAERADRSAKTSVGKTDILQILLDMQMNNEDPTSSFGNTELKAILTDIVTAGVDSTATTIVWVMARLLHHPAAMEVVTDELIRVVGKDSMVEEFHLPQLKYLDAVLKETFRLHPILPLLVPKTPREDTTLCGYKIPKGSKVFVNVWGIHRDPRFWKNPEEFRPERFLEDDANCDLFGNNCRYMPFGSGRRICAGIPLAEKLAKYVVASFVYAFKWELAEGAEVEFAGQLGISLKKMNSLVAIPTTRFPNSVICK